MRIEMDLTKSVEDSAPHAQDTKVTEKRRMVGQESAGPSDEIICLQSPEDQRSWSFANDMGCC